MKSIFNFLWGASCHLVAGLGPFDKSPAEHECCLKPIEEGVVEPIRGQASSESASKLVHPNGAKLTPIRNGLVLVEFPVNRAEELAHLRVGRGIRMEIDTRKYK
jgi:hypothetical protein